MSGDFVIQQWEKYDGDNWWKWAVWIEGRDEDLDRVDFVEWSLHPTFSRPVREIRDRGSRFRLETAGWGGFQILALVQTKDGEQIKLRHQLVLYYPAGVKTTE
jgi:transcription initiation factor IIF auxiliary subunit